MPMYICRVADAKGKIQEITREASSEETLVRELSAGGNFVLSLKSANQGAQSTGKRRKFSLKMVMELTDLLTLMLSSGLSLKDSLDVAEAMFTGGQAKSLVELLIEKIRKGGTFASALDAAGSSFPSVYRGMVRIGERIGSLDQVFSRLSTYLKDEKKLRERFGTALTYPLIVAGTGLAAVVMIVVFILPKMKDMFSQIGPGMATRFNSLMSTVTTVFVAIGIIVVVGTVLITMASRARKKGGAAAVRIDHMILKIPIISQLLVDRELLNFAFAMETLASAGVSVEEALQESSGAATNHAMRAEILSIRENVLKGEKLSTAFAAHPLFPQRISRWIGIGERVGHVEKVFSQLRVFYQQEVDKWLTQLMGLMEPALIVGMGVVIVIFVILFIVPIFSMFGQVA